MKQNFQKNKIAKADISYLEYPLSRTFIISNFFFGPFSTLHNFHYRFLRYLTPRFLELSLCRTIFSVPSVLFRAVLHPLTQTFSFHSFKCWNNIFENFDRMLIFFLYLFPNRNMLIKQKLNVKKNKKIKKIKIKIIQVFFYPLLPFNYLPLVSQCTKYSISFTTWRLYWQNSVLCDRSIICYSPFYLS